MDAKFHLYLLVILLGAIIVQSARPETDQEEIVRSRRRMFLQFQPVLEITGDSPIPGLPDSRIPQFPDSPIPRFPDSPIPDSPFPVLKIAGNHVNVFIPGCV